MAASAATLAIAGTHAPANGSVTVSIGFDFVAGDRTMPAGDYVIQPQGADRLRICEDGIRCATVATESLNLPGLMTGATLVFQRADGQYTLVQVWTSARSGHRVTGGAPESEYNWKSAEFVEVKAKSLCVHRIAGLPTGWH